jgi:hypothetical protein
MLKHLYALCGVVTLLFAWNAHAASEIWQDVSPAQAGARGVSEIRYFQANDSALRSALPETGAVQDHQLEIPMPNGELALFKLREFPVMAPELAAKYPGIKTYRVVGVDDPHATGVIDITPLGFHGMISTSEGRVFIDPQDFRLQDHIYRTRFARHETRKGFNCGVVGHAKESIAPVPMTGLKTAQRLLGTLLEYRLAVAVTLEYYQLFGDDLSTTSAIATTIARVNFVYARDHGILLTLVGNNDQVYESTESNLLDNENSFQLLGQVNSWIDNRIGDGAYDIGHMFSNPSFSNAGGVANIGAVCNSSIKAGGVSGSDVPMGSSFDIDLVAHEIGHQFNAEHSFNGTTRNCINRNAGTAYEPGSGSTIMAYAGICDEENLQINSDASFHAGSISQVNAFTEVAGSCYSLNNTPPSPIPAPNADPIITAIPNTTIPANTPFLLGDPAGPPAATDVDLDTLQYRWDQMDAGCPTDSASFGTDNGSNALFRSYAPRPEAWRNFPALGTQVTNPREYDQAEVLPCHSRALNFRLTVTDGNSGQDSEDVLVNVIAAAGPFEITNLDPDPGIVSGTPFQVDWDPAGTDAAPISCANVDIDLLAFNPTKSRYTVYALGTVANAVGSAMVTLTPNTASHPRSRIRVKCSDNIFYDLSDRDLNITAGMGPGVPLNDSALVAQPKNNATMTGTAPSCPAIVDCSAPPPTGDTGSGGRDASAFGHAWLLLLGGLAALRRIRCRQG